MAQTAQQQLEELNKKRVANQARIDKLAATGGNQKEIDQLSGNQAEMNKQRDSLMSAVNAEKQIAAGTVQGEKFIPTGSLGRLDTELGRVDTGLGRVEEGQFQEARSEDIQDVINRRREALSGMSTEEQRVQRDRALQSIGRAEQLQQNQLKAAQAQSGVRGATASAQQLLAGQQFNQQRIEFERDLFLANEESKRQALNAFESSVTAAEGVEFQRKAANLELQQFNLAQQLRERQLQQTNLAQEQAEKQLEQFNLQQAAKEKFGQVSTALGFAQLTQADISGQRAVEAQKASAAAASGGGK